MNRDSSFTNTRYEIPSLTQVCKRCNTPFLGIRKYCPKCYKEVQKEIEERIKRINKLQEDRRAKSAAMAE